MTTLVNLEKFNRNGISGVRVMSLSGKRLMNVNFDWSNDEIIENVLFEVNSNETNFTKEERLEIANSIIELR